ncbi:type II secretion system protein E [Spirochaeta thermophila DSM 6578]|uniref:Type II secretion system protein E n=1 Tax=Winmispira thermophila (strain ATCC 700085 / DSM 6578 / Z-1203) TaxID=869211 RepID=G0GAU4_WINT7|nr:GspE/PulE family protein [Spirochaeta thermophila]AEJ61840.1 type II secretion system protein E [Spirochaeta thermophila DSM 6578]
MSMVEKDDRGSAEVSRSNVQYPLEFCEANRVLLDEETEEYVRVLMCDPEDRELLDLLGFYHRKRVVPVKISAVEFATILGRLESSEEEKNGEGGGGERIFLDRISNDAPVVNLVNSLILDALHRGSSDIHIECFTEYAAVRFRLDGVLFEMQRLSRERFAAVSTRLKVMAGLNIMERRLPQDGRITAEIEGHRIDMRVSFVPIVRGESIVIRLFTTREAGLALEDLGFEVDVQETVQRLLRYPHGLILSTGPTGSGKSTTLYAMLRRLHQPGVKIITVEDPIENVLDGINQIQVHEAIGLSFDSLLRRVLRQDPDIIMVGEVRDESTAELVVRAALTGHLVLSTLHTNDAISAIDRLRNMGVETYMIATVLRGVLAQRLVRRLCPHCVYWREPAEEERALWERIGEKVERLPMPGGCELCRHTGYQGRLPIVEYVVMDDDLAELVGRGERVAIIRRELERRDFQPLFKRALGLVSRGFTTMEEIQREVELPV